MFFLLKDDCFFGFILESDWLHEKCAIGAEIALLLTNQIAGNAIDFKMNKIN